MSTGTLTKKRKKFRPDTIKRGGRVLMRKKHDLSLEIPVDERERERLETIARVLEERRLGRTRPVQWVERVLESKLWSKQRQILNAIAKHPRVAVKSGNACGKSYLAANIACWFLPNHVPSYVITSASSWKGIEKIQWPTMRALKDSAKEEWFRQYGHLYESSMEWKIAPQHGAFGVSTKSAENFAGFRSPGGTLVIYDEASAITYDIYEAIMGLAASSNVKIFFIGNPLTPEGPFHDCFTDPSWKTFTISAYDSPNVKYNTEIIPGLATAKWIEERKAAWGEDSAAFKARVLGEFPDTSEDQVISLADIHQATNRDLTTNPQEPVYVGVDVARYGDDCTIIYVVKGNKVIKTIESRKKSLMDVVALLVKIVKEYSPAMISIDEVGIGAGVVDRMLELGHGHTVCGVNMAKSATDPNKYYNLRAELWFETKKWLQEIGDIPDDPILVGDLTAPKYRFTPDDRVQLERKEHTKKRLTRSPDHGDALILAISGQRWGQTTWWCH